MNGATMQAKLYKGMAKAAAKMGLTCSLYRPLIATAPFGNLVTSLPAQFRVDDKFSKPNTYGKPQWLAFVDGSQTAVGDILQGPQGTFFIAAMQQLLPILVVETNHTITLARCAIPGGFGAQTYNADTAGTETAYATGWPASILKGPKGEANEVGLPGDVRQPWWDCLLPLIPGAPIATADIITDEMGSRYIVSVAELSDLGWRLTLQQAVT
jgi:hypothetical protein